MGATGSGIPGSATFRKSRRTHLSGANQQQFQKSEFIKKNNSLQSQPGTLGWYKSQTTHLILHGSDRKRCLKGNLAQLVAGLPYGE